MGKQSSIVFENVNTSSPNSIALIVMSQQQYTNWNQNLTGSATNDFPTYCSTTYFTCLYGLYISSSGITNVKILIPYTSVWYIVFWNSVKSTSVYSVSYTITINIQQTKQVIDLYGLISGNIIVVVIIAGCIIISKKVYKYLIQIIQIYDS